MYENVGKLMAISIANRGPVPCFLHPQLYVALSEGIDKAQPSVSDINDPMLRSQVYEVSSNFDGEGRRWGGQFI